MSISGLKFNETMSGPFSLGETEPQSGSNNGRKQNQILAMHANIVIDDMDLFIADPDHLGGLSGTIDFAPFGQGIKSHSGVFNLFSPTDEKDTKFMVYELGFTYDGKSYYLAGHKVVRNDKGFDMLSDTTTLYTTLYEGKDKTGPAAGAGILSLGIFDLMALVSTIRATDADSTVESAKTIATFGKFFMGELWDIYGLGS